jgi:hypothetical protein
MASSLPVSLFALMALVSCHAMPPQAPPATVDQSAVTAASITEISLERRCFGCTREGKLTLRRDGTATRVVFGNARAGTADRESSATLAGGAFEELAAAIVSERFFDLRDEYRDPAIADGESSVLTVTAGGRQKSVLNRNAMAPASFQRLESRIDALADRLTWRLAP